MNAGRTETGDSGGDRVCVGAVTGVRGLGGEVRIKSFTAEPDAVGAYGPVTTENGERAFEVRVTARAKGHVVARLTGVDDRDAAEALKGMRLYVPKAALPAPDDGAYYHADLVGLGAETAAGERLGRVKAVHNFGAGDVIEIVPDDGSDGAPKGGLMVPFTRSAVPEVDVRAGRLVVAAPAEVVAEPGPDGARDGGDG